MKHFLLAISLFFLCCVSVFAQFADPAVTGANYVPNEITIGQNAQLTVSFANSGSTAIPVGSIELTISTAPTYYKSDGVTQPSGVGAGLFNWSYLGSDVWRGTNKVVVPAFGGGTITLAVSGLAISPGFETTNVNVQPVNSFGSFNNAANNDNLQPKLKVNAAPAVPIANNDNATTPQNTPITINSLTNDNLNGGTSPVLSVVTQSPNGTASVVNGQFLFTPTTGFSGTTTFTYKITASNGVSNTATVTVVVPAPAPLPIANNDNATTPRNTPVTLTPLSNDVVNGTLQSINIISQPANGSVVVSGNNFVFTPANGFTGTTTFPYTITTTNGTSNQATETIVVTAPTPLPIANNDNATTPQNTAVTITPLSNDVVNGTLQSITIKTQPANGSVVLSGNNFVFTPTNGFSGTTTFTYCFTTSNGTSNTATVTVVVPAPALAPVAVNDNATTPQNTPVTVPVLTNDNLNGGTNPVVSIVTPSPNGTATVSGNQIVFTPTTGFSGTTTLTYKITASNGTSNTATVTVVVPAPAQLPIANNDNATTPQNTPVTLTPLSNDVVNGTLQSINIMAQPANGSVVLSGNNFVFTPTNGFTGTTTFPYTITTTNGTSNQATETIVVTGGNGGSDICTASAANIVGGAGVITIKGITTSAAIVQVFDATFSSNVYTQQISTSTTTVTLPAAVYFVKVTVLGAGGTYPVVCEVLEQVTVTGGTVTPPVAVNDNATTPQNTPVTVPVLTNDNLNGGTNPVVSIVTPSPNGTATVSGNQIVFTPTTGFSGTTTLTYKITASNGTSNTATVTIVVPAPALAPVAVNDNATTPQNTPVTVPVLSNDNLNGGTNPVVSIVTPSPNGTATVSGNQIVFTPTTGFSGTTTLTYKIIASNGTSNTATVTIVVPAPALAPVAVNDNAITPQNTPVTVPVLSNDNLNGGTNPVVSIVTPSPNGTATVSGNQIVFTPTTGFSGTTTLTYKITASNGTSNTATVTIVVPGGNGGTDLCANPSANIVGGAGSITITGITTSAAMIQVFNSSWSSVYNQQVSTSSVTIPNLPLGAYNVKVTVLKAGGRWPSVCDKQVTISVTGGGSNTTSPTANNDNVTTPQNSAVTISPLSNDVIPNGCTVQSLVITSQPANGSVVVNGNNFVYTPASGFSGTNGFKYKIVSSCGTSNEATVSVTVQATAIDCSQFRNNSITKSCANGAPVLTGTALAGYEYMWISSTISCSTSDATPIAGATSQNYTFPTNVTQTTYISRCARPIGCTVWDAVAESNCLTLQPGDCGTVATGCAGVNVVGNNNGTITITGLAGYTSQIQVFNTFWQPVSNKTYTQSGVSISVKNGAYIVKVQLYTVTGGWKLVCEKLVQNVTVSGSHFLISNTTTLELVAKPELHRVQLGWVNNSGDNNDYFQVEKLNQSSGDFEKLATVNSRKGIDVEYYTTFDEQPNEGDNTYRISLIDIDGKVKRSNQSTVKFTKTVDFGIFPNPASDFIEVDLRQYNNKAVQLYIYDNLGQLILTRAVEKASNAPVHLDLNSKISGSYFLRITSQGKKDLIKKFVIQQ